MLKKEVKRAAEKVEKNCEEFQKIMVKRKKDKLAGLEKKLNVLKDGGAKFIAICKSFKTKISEEMGDGLKQDVIEKFLKDIKSGTLSEKEAFKNLCDTVNEKVKHAIANATANANEEFEQWDKLMVNVSTLGESKFSAIDSQASQFSISEELPKNKYNPWGDPWSYFTGNFAKSAGLIAVAAASGGFGMFSTVLWSAKILFYRILCLIASETRATAAYYTEHVMSLIQVLLHVLGTILMINTRNQKTVLANEIISCYLLFTCVSRVFIYKSFWKEFESSQRRLTLPVSNVCLPVA